MEGSRTKTLRLSSRDRDGAFRSLCHMPLSKIEDIAQVFLDNGIIRPTGRMRNLELVRVKAELHVMAAICHHTHGHPYRILSINTNISNEEHRKFFHEFIHYFFENHTRYVYLPKQGARECRTNIQNNTTHRFRQKLFIVNAVHHQQIFLLHLRMQLSFVRCQPIFHNFVRLNQACSFNTSLFDQHFLTHYKNTTNTSSLPFH